MNLLQSIHSVRILRFYLPYFLSKLIWTIKKANKLLNRIMDICWVRHCTNRMIVQRIFQHFVHIRLLYRIKMFVNVLDIFRQIDTRLVSYLTNSAIFYYPIVFISPPHAVISSPDTRLKYSCQHKDLDCQRLPACWSLFSFFGKRSEVQ